MPTTTRLFRSGSGMPLHAAAAAVSLLWLTLPLGAVGQSAEVSQTASAAAVIPQQVRYAGAMPDRGGETVEVTFRIYATAEGGEALWTESQMVPVGRDGTYAVLLGAASQSGLPQTVFAAGQARWVGVSIDRAEGSPRTPLSSVAYAMKAGDAETVGGLAAGSLATKDELDKLIKTVATVQQIQPQIQIQPEATPTGAGTMNYVPLWTGTATLGNSNIFQGSTGYIGLGTAAPGGPLEVATGALGGANATMMLVQTNAASGNYYADIGLYNSKGLIGNLSALGAGYPSGNLFVANDVVFLGGQQNASTNLIMLTNTSGAIKFGTGGFGIANERLRIGAAGGVSIGNGYVGTDPGAGNLIVSGTMGIGTAMPAAKLEVNGTAKFDGLITFGAGQTFPGTGAGTITGITTTSPLTGSGTTGSVALGINTTALETTEETTYDKRYALLSGGDSFTGAIDAHQKLGKDYAAVLGSGANGSIGIYGDSDSGYAVQGQSGTGQGVVGSVSAPAVGSSGVLGYTNSAFSVSYSTNAGVIAAGVWGDTSSPDNSFVPAGIVGTSDVGYGGIFVNSSADYATILVSNSVGDGAGIAATGASGDGLQARAANGNGVYSSAENPASGQAGVVGVAVSPSNTGSPANSVTFAGVWGDSGVNTDSIPNFAAGVLGTADNSYAGWFTNNSTDATTLYVYNYGSGGVGTAGTGTPRLFNTFMAGSASGTCGVSGGSMSCTGPIKSLASAGGSRTVETYAVQSPENWMEDFGSGSLVNGHATVSLDPAFAAVVAGDASYHVFITPNGDSKGHLYVAVKTTSGFEVRESSGGTSSLSFDYRVVAKRAGYEAQRMVDVTETFNRETSRAKFVAAKNIRPAVRVKPASRLEQALKTPHRIIVPNPAPRPLPQAAAVPAHPAASK